jgi:hypothetical protein
MQAKASQDQRSKQKAAKKSTSVGTFHFSFEIKTGLLPNEKTPGPVPGLSLTVPVCVPVHCN